MAKRSFLQTESKGFHQGGEEDEEEGFVEEEEEEEEDGEEEEEEEEQEQEEEEVINRKGRILVTVIIGGRKERRRRPRPLQPHTIRRVVGCQVDGCDADLGAAKSYHRRHKVCECHAKATVVPICGVDQRYCQQCSRFHELLEFDGLKRSCRNRLAGHNERRRKIPHEPQAEESLSSAS